MSNFCNVCGVATTNACGTCGSVFYCQREHQKQDWKEHKKNCHKPNGMLKAVQSSEDGRIGVCSYQGDFKDGLEGIKHGYGSLTLPDRTTYVGQFKDDEYHGYGCLEIPTGKTIRKYEGEFKNGLPHGKGKMTNNNGAVAEGTFLNGNMHGNIKLVVPETFGFTTFEGEYSDGAKVKGTFNYYNGNSYTGEFRYDDTKGDLQHGKGKYIDSTNNVVYEGGYKDDLRHGYGKYSHLDGRVIYAGQWANGQPEPKPN